MIGCLKCLTLLSLKENHLEFKIMDAREKNKIKSKEYYYRTKDNLSEEVKAKRKEQARIRALRFYHKNKELCKLRVNKTRVNDESKINEIETKIKHFDTFITQSEIQFIKGLNLVLLIKKAPRLTMWDKKINEWTFKDYNKLQSLLT